MKDPGKRFHESLEYTKLPQIVTKICRRCGQYIESDDKSYCSK